MKPETEIRNLKRELRQSEGCVADLGARTRKFERDIKIVGELLLKAEKELDEWKSRFDVLLAMKKEPDE